MSSILEPNQLPLIIVFFFHRFQHDFNSFLLKLIGFFFLKMEIYTVYKFTELDYFPSNTILHFTCVNVQHSIFCNDLNKILKTRRKIISYLTNKNELLDLNVAWQLQSNGNNNNNNGTSKRKKCCIIQHVILYKKTRDKD